MKLPLDNFQVLGVSPGSSARNILMILERRLESCNYPGFTEKTLRYRKELLKEYSKPLLDTEKRKELENLYQTLDSKEEERKFIISPHGSEVAGLLLLLESGDCNGCFNLANDFLSHKLQEQISDRSQDADLYLLIGYATLEYAGLLKSQRHYEYCVRILEKGLGLIKNKIVYGEVEQTICKELEDIIPFQILDLLSRDMDDPIRDFGIQILGDFVMKRGGLDGESSLCMKDDEFKAFFRQIRYYLTVQEQIDLYQDWCKKGSASACFLLVISLVASGFARRKPERLVQAQEIIQKIDSIELNEITAYISLLLGNVNILGKLPSLLKDNEKTTRDPSSEVDLGNLCAGCREWLAIDVLEGYRDLEADPDLEAYFSDRDVTMFIERYDSDLTLQNSSNRSFLDQVELSNRLLQRSGHHKRFQLLKSNPNAPIESRANTKVINRKELVNVFRHKGIVSALSLLLVLAAWSIIAKRNETKQGYNWKTAINKQGSYEGNEHKKTPKSLNRLENTTINYNISSHPSASELKDIISEWLRIKSQVLSGLSFSDRLAKIATLEAIQRLESERKEDATKREKQLISAQITNLDILSREEKRIEVMATLKYSDKRVNENNKVVETTPKHVFKKIYILVNRGGGWVVQ